MDWRKRASGAYSLAELILSPTLNADKDDGNDDGMKDETPRYLMVFGKFSLWIEYFNNIKKCWETLLGVYIVCIVCIVYIVYSI